MSRVSILLVILSLGLACSKSTETVQGEREVWSGVMHVERSPDTVGGEDTDTVTLVIQEPSYSFWHHTNRSGICDSEGRITGYGEPLVHFNPTLIHRQNCDTMRVPRGSFDCVFQGDTLLIMTRTDIALNTRFDIRLTR